MLAAAPCAIQVFWAYLYSVALTDHNLSSLFIHSSIRPKPQHSMIYSRKARPTPKQLVIKCVCVTPLDERRV